VVNVLGFFNHLREFIRTAVQTGFIRPDNERLLTFVDGPSIAAESPSSSEIQAHESFDWGAASLKALEDWDADSIHTQSYDWSVNVPPETDRNDNLDAT
jgi:hypothetical protein